MCARKFIGLRLIRKYSKSLLNANVCKMHGKIQHIVENCTLGYCSVVATAIFAVFLREGLQRHPFVMPSAVEAGKR